MKHFLITSLLLIISAVLCYAQEDTVTMRKLFSWDFNSQHIEGKTIKASKGNQAELEGKKVLKLNNKALELKDGNFLKATQLDRGKLPTSAMTAEIMINIGKYQGTKGIMSLYNKGKGWMLGVQDRHITLHFTCQGKQTSIPMMKNLQQFPTGQWLHILFTYEGSELCLYVNGQLQAFQKYQGSIILPDQGKLSFAAIKDMDKISTLACRVKMAAIYEGAMTPIEITSRYQELSKKLP